MSERTHAAETWLTVDDVAKLLFVSAGTVHNRIKAGDLPYTEKHGKRLILLAALRPAKLVREKDVLARADVIEAGVEPKDLAAAIAVGAVVPSDEQMRRFSLEDVDALIRFKKGLWTAPTMTAEPEPPAQPERPAEAEAAEARGGVEVVVQILPALGEFDGLQAGSEYWSVLFEYIGGHKDPFKIPKPFWNTRSCPEFIPPAGVFRFTYGAFDFDEATGIRTLIKRSEGWVQSESTGKLEHVAEDPAHAFELGLTPAIGRDHPQFKVRNLRWHQLKRDWEAAWYQHRRELRAQGVDPTTVAYLPTQEPKDRRELLKRYRAEHWTEEDLPDWFWDEDQPPPFEQPTQACRFQYGERAPDPNGSGQQGTWIRRTGIYQHPIGDAVFYEAPAARFEWVPGEHAEGEVPLDYELASREYDQHVQAWQREWERRRRRRLGLDD